MSSPPLCGPDQNRTRTGPEQVEFQSALNNGITAACLKWEDLQGVAAVSMFRRNREFRRLEASRQTKTATVNPAALWEFLQIKIITNEVTSHFHAMTISFQLLYVLTSLSQILLVGQDKTLLMAKSKYLHSDKSELIFWVKLTQTKCIQS